jgi:hypothetical protein
MIAFLVFLAVMVAFIVGCVCISMSLSSSNATGCLQGQQLATVSQVPFVKERPYKQRRGQPDMGMSECALRVFGISLGIVIVMLVLVITFFIVAL